MLFKKILKEELQKIEDQVGYENYVTGRFEEAAEIFSELTIQDEFEEFLTIPSYQHIS